MIPRFYLNGWFGETLSYKPLKGWELGLEWLGLHVSISFGRTEQPK